MNVGVLDGRVLETTTSNSRHGCSSRPLFMDAPHAKVPERPRWITKRGSKPDNGREHRLSHVSTANNDDALARRNDEGEFASG